MEPTSDLRQRASDELALLYQVTVADLAFFKQQQWSITSYAVLVYAGIGGATQLIVGPLQVSETIALGALVCAAAIAASIALWKAEAAIEVRRDRLKSKRENFTDAFFTAWGSRGKLEERVSILWLLQTVLVVGTGVALWVLHRQ